MTNKQFVRFAIVGAINTLTDSLIFTALRITADLNLVLANVISTSCALLVSLLLHNSYTFKNHTLSRYRVVAFILITLSGLWILQPLIILLFTELHTFINYTAPLFAVVSNDGFWITFIPKLIAISTTVVWNYVWYSKVIFISHNTTKQS